MLSELSAPGPFAQVVCCPRCHGPLPVGQAGACVRCGAACRVEGPVVNFLGDAGFRMPAKNDVAMATWLLANRARLADVLAEMRAALVNDPRGPLPGSAQLAADGSVTPQDVAHMLDSGPFNQILNDLTRFAEGRAVPSETVQFMLAQSEIGPGSRVLDAGCSCGRHLWELAGKGPELLVGVDVHLLALAVGALAWEAQGMPGTPHWCCASVLQLPFRDASFTHVNSFVVLSGVPIRAGLRELARVLEPGGRLVFTVEGLGYWQICWEGAPALSVKRAHLLRWWLGNKLLEFGIDWQRHPLSRRLSGLTQFAPRTVRREVERAGLVVEEFEVLRWHRGQPRLLGVSARKPGGAARPASAATHGRRELQYQ